MEERIIKSTIKVCSKEELPTDEQRLVDMAFEATGRSYAKYSHFCVGAAVLLANGQTVIGCNQENAAFGVTICAERVALFSAGALYPGVAVKAIAIAARNGDGPLSEPVSPCGSCRQAMIETEQRSGCPLRILLCGTRRIYAVDGIATLMPLSFSDEQM